MAVSQAKFPLTVDGHAVRPASGRLLIARVLNRLGRSERALKLLLSAPDPSAAEVLRTGWIQERLGQLDDAIETLEPLVFGSKVIEGAPSLLARAFSRQGDRFTAYRAALQAFRGPTPDGTVLLDAARRASSVGDFHEAARIAQLATSNPSAEGGAAGSIRHEFVRDDSLAVDLAAYGQLQAALNTTGSPQDVASELVDFLRARDNLAGALRIQLDLLELHGVGEPWQILQDAIEWGVPTAGKRIAAQYSLIEGPHTDEQAVALARLMRADRFQAVVYDPVLGIVTARQGRLDRASQLLASRLAVDAHSSPVVDIELGDIYLAMHRIREAAVHFRRALESDHATPHNFAQLGRCLQHPQLADFPGALRAYSDGSRLHPDSRVLAVRTMRMAARLQDWSEARAAATRIKHQMLADHPDSRESVERLAQIAHDALGDGFTHGSADTLHELRDCMNDAPSEVVQGALPLLDSSSRKQLIDGAFLAGFDLRRALARFVLSNPGQTSDDWSHQAARTAIQAALYLDTCKDAHAALKAFPIDTQNLLGLHEKLTADLSLADGDLTTFRNYWTQRRADLALPGDEQFGELVHGRRVALVGPSDIVANDGAEIDSFDTVVRIRFQPALVLKQAEGIGSRTDVSYYSGRDFVRLPADVVAELDGGDLAQVVGRPMMFLPGEELRLDGRTRFARSEFSLYFRSSPLGLQRAVYDLLQFGPAELKLFNFDLYSSTKKFTLGYRDARDSTLNRGSLLADVFASHDLLADYQFVRRLYSSGALQADTRAATLFGLGDDGYLSLLQQGGRF